MPEKDVHPTFENKKVVELTCKYCCNVVCDRGMKAILLADAAVELYSTDLPPPNSIALINSSYPTEKCLCRIKDIACLGCGNPVGYTVVQPCRLCLESCNNGHFWMFLSQSVEAMDRVDHTGNISLILVPVYCYGVNYSERKLSKEIANQTAAAWNATDESVN